MTRHHGVVRGGWRIVVLASYALSACAGPDDLSISEVTSVSADGRTLRLTINSCHGNPTVMVDESADRVILHARGGATADDCADLATVTLREPLGDRIVIDATSQRQVRTPDRRGA